MHSTVFGHMISKGSVACNILIFMFCISGWSYWKDSVSVVNTIIFVYLWSSIGPFCVIAFTSVLQSESDYQVLSFSYQILIFDCELLVLTS